ncbi:MAG: MASE1 domain-containing protein [Myxococcota bacterium]|nr:MASE1 domain-containing protein [Myxococcota bacterium]
MSSARELRALPLAAAMLALAVAYVALGRLGLELALVQSNATLVWPPTGLSIAALVLGGRRLWPGVLLGALAVNLWVGSPGWVAVAIAVGNTLEALAAASLLRVAGFRPELDRLRDVLVYAATGLAACAISATVAAVTLSAAGRLEGSPVGVVWLEWWLGDLGAAAVVAPVAFVVAKGAPSWRSLARRGEVWVAVALALLLSGAVFSGGLGDRWLERLVAYAAFPLVIFAGLRAGPRGAVLIAGLIGVLAVGGTAADEGPFTDVGDTHRGLLLLWAYVTSIGLAATILAAAVAERDAAERERVSAQARAERASHLETLGVLAGGVAHDFNNLLTVIEGNAAMVRETATLDPENARCLRDIDVAAGRAATLCQQLLDYAGGTRRRPRALDLGALVEETVQLVRGSIPQKIELAVEVEPELPPAIVDESQVQQVAMNLLLNARDAIGGRAGRIGVSLRRVDVDAEYLRGCVFGDEREPGRYFALEVTDDGRGMDADTRGRVFEPFFSTKGLGRGLGLASTLGIARVHRGALRVESEPERGTTFTVLFPERDAPSDARRSGPRSAPPPGTVLVADDQPAVLEVAARALESRGWRVLRARDGAEAIATYRAHAAEIDAVILDVDMPEVDGVTAYRELTRIAPDLPVLLASGLGAPAELPDAPCLVKPFDPPRLVEALEQARS